MILFPYPVPKDDSEKPLPKAQSRKRRKRAFTLSSYKVDNNPEAVKHLAKTLGLVGKTIKKALH